MNINCYQCKTSELVPTKLDFGLPSLQCKGCKGTHIDLLTYRTWLEDVSDDIAEQQSNYSEVVSVDELNHSDHALICQRCQKFMRKYKITNDYENSLDICNTCDDIWLESGEWELLKQLKIQDKLTHVMGTPWQADLISQEQESAFVDHYKKVLGDEFNKVNDFAIWLEEQPNKAQIKHYLNTKNQ